jgi:hypothetical protein
MLRGNGMVVTTASPRVLTMEEYEQLWKPQGWQLIIIGPTSTWRQEWGEWEAIREIVQNALDEAEAYQWGYDQQGLWLADRGRGVAVADFLLGPPKLKPDWSRGKYGEGMKIAALALLRKGYSVHVSTAGREIWLIFLVQKVNGHAETLAAIWHANGTKLGTRFHIIGYTGTAFEDWFAVNLPRSAILWEAPSKIYQPIKRYNQLIAYQMPQSKPGDAVISRIYARDIHMRTIRSPYSYNLWSFELAPDRHAPKNEQDLWVDIGRLWCCVQRQDLIEVFLRMVHFPPLLDTDESHNISMERWALGGVPGTEKLYSDFVKEHAAIWKAAWIKNFGENAVIRTSDRWDSTVKHLGYESHSVNWLVQDTLAQAVLTDKELVKASQERLREVETIPDERLSRKQRAHLSLARAIADEVTVTKVSGVHAAIIPPASDRVRTAGMYSRTTMEIYIAADQLERGSTTVDTVIHEIAHHTSGAEDLEEAHSEAMTRVAAKVVEMTHGGKFDRLMREVIW